MESGERKMNPITMNIINPWKEYGPSLYPVEVITVNGTQYKNLLKMAYSFESLPTDKILDWSKWKHFQPQISKFVFWKDRKHCG